MHRESQKADLKINKKKTKVMFKNYIVHHGIEINDEVVECIKEYIYLGQKIGACPDLEKINQKKNRNGMECFR